MKNKNIQSVQIEYMNWILSKMVQRGSKFHKNDILDMLISITLQDSDTVLISFDEDMQDFISSINHISQNYIAKVYAR